MTSNSSKPELLIQVYTDVICPFCYVGHAALEKFLRSSAFQTEIGSKVTPKLEILPYLLDKMVPATDYVPPADIYPARHATPYEENKPPSKREYYSRKFGSSIDAFDAKVTRAAEKQGLEPFQWHTDGPVAATWDCHRLVMLAGRKTANESIAQKEGDFDPPLQSRMIERLYDDYHHHSVDLSSRAYLSQVAVSFDLFADEPAAKLWLESDELESELKHQLLIADMNGVMSIPFIVLQDGVDHMTSVGSPEELLRMFKLVASPYL